MGAAFRTPPALCSGRVHLLLLAGGEPKPCSCQTPADASPAPGSDEAELLGRCLIWSHHQHGWVMSRRCCALQGQSGSAGLWKREENASVLQLKKLKPAANSQGKHISARGAGLGWGWCFTASKVRVTHRIHSPTCSFPHLCLANSSLQSLSSHCTDRDWVRENWDRIICLFSRKPKHQIIPKCLAVGIY